MKERNWRGSEVRGKGRDEGDEGHGAIRCKDRMAGVSVSVIEAVNADSTSAQCAGQRTPLSIPHSMAPGTFPITACINGCCWHTAADWERIGFHFHFLSLFGALISSSLTALLISSGAGRRTEERSGKEEKKKSPLMMEELILSFTVSYAGLQKLSCQFLPVLY